jgi:hypothetical protein
MNQIATATAAMTATPPTTPPAIAPTGVDFLSDTGAAVVEEADAEELVEELPAEETLEGGRGVPMDADADALPEPTEELPINIDELDSDPALVRVTTSGENVLPSLSST